MTFGINFCSNNTIRACLLLRSNLLRLDSQQIMMIFVRLKCGCTQQVRIEQISLFVEALWRRAFSMKFVLRLLFVDKKRLAVGNYSF